MPYELDRDDRGLTARERKVLELKRGGKTPVEIGDELGVTRQRVYAILKQIKRKGVKV